MEGNLTAPAVLHGLEGLYIATYLQEDSSLPQQGGLAVPHDGAV